ncbi:MAG: ADP-ribosylglycohydrolase family protein [Lentisphaerales bacterium]|nr:ADP-ribosylglycohydrolase family protein [Lentisphaerales bacterium]
MEQTANKILAAFYGLAFGDALGSTVDTVTVNEIEDRYGKHYEALNFDFDAPLFTVGDDTQMALYTALSMRAAIKSPRPIDEIAKHLCIWFLDPQNNRPASQQNLRAIEKLNNGIHWMSATNTSINSSTVLVRNLPIAFWLCSPEVQKIQRWQLTQEAAVLTHASSESIVASCLLNEAVSLLLSGYRPSELPKMLKSAAIDMSSYWSENLGDKLWGLPGFLSADEYLEIGFNKCLGKIHYIESLLESDKEHYDPCELLGEGWDAEEALAVGLYCFLINPDNPEAVVKRAAFSNGPSDTLAAITGALGGAYNGTEAWPAIWLSKIEYHEEILELSRVAGRKALI